MAFPTAPVDNSGGILTLGLSDGVDEHFVRLHVKQFTATVPSSPYAWTYSVAAGTDVSVRQTAISFIDKVKTLYTTDWTFWVERLERVSGGVATPIFPIPDVGAENGAISGPVLALGSPARFIETVYDLNTSFGGRFRFMLPAATTTTDTIGSVTGPRELLQAPRSCTATAGGYDTTLDPAIIAYLTGGNCGVLAHDGHQPIGTAKMSMVDNKRLRRKYGFA